MTFSLAGKPIRRVYGSFPLYGVGSVGIDLAVAADLPIGPARLVLGDATLEGTIVDGGVVAGEARYSWLQGAAGWAEPLPARAYGTTQVRRSTVLRDAAQAAGESISIDIPDVTLGLPGSGGFVRLPGPAANIFGDLGLPWWLAFDGVTHVGVRPGGPIPTDGAVIQARQEDQIYVITPREARIAGYLPGRAFRGKTVALVELEAMEGEPIRITLYLREADDVDVSQALRAQLDRLVDQQTARTRFYGRYRYFVTAKNGALYGGVPADPDLGLPNLDNRALWFGTPGTEADITPDPGDSLREGGEERFTVVVSFLDGDPSRPVIDGYLRDIDRRPTVLSFDAGRLNLGAASQLVARKTDPVGCGDLKLSVVAGLFLLQLYDDAGGLVKTWQIAGANGGGPVTWVITPLPLGSDSAPIDGVILTPGQDRTYA